MNIYKKRLARRFYAAALATILFLSTIFSLRILMGDNHVAYAAESGIMGTNSYLPDKIAGAALAVGETYTLGGNACTGGTAAPQAQVLAVEGNRALMQSKGLWGGTWPGEGELSGIAGTYFGDLRNAISDVYLPKKTDNSKITVFWNGAQTAAYSSTVHSIVADAARDCRSYTNYSLACSWLGSGNYVYPYGTTAYHVHSSSSNGTICNMCKDDSMICAPVFTINTTRVALANGILTYAPFADAAGIMAEQAVTSVGEGVSVDLRQVITGVRYYGGDNEGRSASYTVAVGMNDGSINGTTWTAPTGINSVRTVALTVRDTVKNFTTTRNITVTPRTARSIVVEKLSRFPETVTVGDTIDLSSYIRVTGYDSASESDGEITNYTLSVNPLYGTTVGTVYMPANISSTRDITLTVTPGTLGSVDYGKTSAAFTVRVKPDATGWTDRDANTDALGFHSYTDPLTKITWKYRYNDDGYILYLYTEDDVAGIITDGHTLLVPSSINGVPVVGIGGGSKDSQVIPFIPCEGGRVNNTWTGIYIPGSVKMIHDGAFYKNGAGADIVIPGNISEIGVSAFKKSKIKSVTFHDGDSLILGTESFADIPTLARVVLRGHDVTMRQRVFSHDTGLVQVDIPNGTKFKGAKDQNDSYVFEGTTGLELIKIDTSEVPGNIFSGNRNLKKVIFGEHVSRVKYDWSGTAASNRETLDGTVARQTYVLNADTIFEMDKATGGSAFGYANELKVVGKSRSLDSDDDSYNNMADPVTAKIAYLAHYYKTNYEVRNYAKGTGSDIVITAEGEPADNEEVISTIPGLQTGIEAYYKGAIFNGKTLDKNKTDVYKMYGDKQKGTYETSEFYVLRTAEADALLAAENASQINGEKDPEGKDVYVATDTDQVLAAFEAKDTVAITDSDLSTGTVDVKVIVLWKDRDGNILVDPASGHVIAYAHALAIPVREYTAENDFFENYGSYSAVISKIDGLSDQVNELAQTVADREAEIAHLSEEKDQLQGQYDELARAQSDNQELIASLAAQLTEKSQALEDATEKLADCKEKLATYIAAYNELIQELKKYISETDMDESGYFGTIVSADENSGGTTERNVVYIDGEPYDYEKTNQSVMIDGKDCPIYSGTGDLDHDGADETFLFFVTKDGVTILEEIADPENPDQTVYMPKATYTDTIGAIQRRAEAKLAAVSAELETLKDQISDLEGQVTELQGQIGALHTRNSELEAENGQLKQDKEALQKELEALKAAHAEELREANAKAEELKKQLAQQETAAKAAQETLENKNASAEKKLAAAQTQIAALNANVSKLQETNNGLQEQLAQTKPDAGSSSGNMEEAETDSTVSALTSHNQTLYSQLADLKTENTALTAQLLAAKKSGGSLKTKNKTLNASNAKLSAENKKLAASLEAVRKSLAAARSQLDALTQSNTVLEKSNTKYKKKNERLVKKNRGLSNENASLSSQAPSMNARPSLENAELRTRPAETTAAVPSAVAAVTPQKQEPAAKSNQVMTTMLIVVSVICVVGGAAAFFMIREKMRRRKMGIKI